MKTQSPTLRVENLHVEIHGKEILHGIDFVAKKGEIHALMGPNGSGKSTLAQVFCGHPDYKITGGSITFNNHDITSLAPEKRAHLGLFLAFQYPHIIPGVKLATFLKQAVNAQRRNHHPPLPPLKIREYREMLRGAMEQLHMPEAFAERYLNEGFSGGEKKKAEILQMAMLKPTIAILDETDSGLDVDALKTVCDGVQRLREETGMGVLLITHYPRILKYIQPDVVHILMHGRIVHAGGPRLAHTIEEQGYAWLATAVKI